MIFLVLYAHFLAYLLGGPLSMLRNFMGLFAVLFWAGIWLGSDVMAGTEMKLGLHQVPGQAELGYAEISGVAAGVFAPEMWEKGTLNLLPDQRSPLLAPRLSGVFRNIYAPSAVETPAGWRLFYGAWDGVNSGNDRIYSALTANFLDFADRQTVIEHGSFVHVCNVNAISNGAGFDLVCTAYPDSVGQNKPIFFTSPDGVNWNGSPAPYEAQPSDLMTMQGYEAFAPADMNGVNVLLKEDGQYHLYFGNFKDWGHVYRASSPDGKNFTFEGSALDVPHMVNDVKKLVVGDKLWYLMGLHSNGDHLWYSLSNDGMKFGSEKVLATNLGPGDRYIVALGWVVRGNRVLGVLYGAGEVKYLNLNRIYGRWLQTKVVFVAEDGKRYEPVASLGPDRQLIPVPKENQLNPIKGHYEFFAEDGVTPMGEPIEGTIASGAVYQVDQLPAEEGFVNLLESDLSKWEAVGGGTPDGWSLKDGILEFAGKGKEIKLKEDYGDFILRLEYRLPPAGNSGVFIRQPKVFSAFEGIEIQILDHHAVEYKDIKPTQHTGSIYAVVAAATDPIHDAGEEWNSMEVYCRGSRIRTSVNGKILTDADVDTYRELCHRPKRGGLGLQNHGSKLQFRNIRVMRLD